MSKIPIFELKLTIGNLLCFFKPNLKLIFLLNHSPGAIPGYGESVSPTPPMQSREPQSAPPTANGFSKSNDRRGSEEGGRRDSRSPPNHVNNNHDGPRGERPKGQVGYYIR